MSINVRLFIGLVRNPGIGRWFDVADSSEVDAAFEATEAEAEGNEVLLADCEPSWLHKVERSELGEIVEYLAETHHDESVLRAAFDYDSKTFRAILDSVSGPYRDRADYAEQFANDTGMDIPAHLAPYVDFDAMARDWILGGDIVELDCDDGHYYFHSSY